MCCTSLQVSKGLRRPGPNRDKHHDPITRSYLLTVPACLDFVCGRAAYLASKVRAKTPAAMEEESEVPDLVRLQLRCGPNVTCRGHQIFLAFLIFNSIKPAITQDCVFLLCSMASVGSTLIFGGAI